MTSQMMSRAREQVQTLLENAERVLIVAHIEPDGDAIGSALGLAWALRQRGAT